MNQVIEEFKPIKGFNEIYSVSNLGNVKNNISNKILTNQIHSGGYRMITLRKDKKRHIKYIHRLVYEHFGQGYDNKLLVDHINCDKTDNNINNLRMCTNQQNSHNSGLSKANKTGFKGVALSKRTKKYVAYVGVNYKVLVLGSYEKLDDAVAARKAKVNELFGLFTNQLEKL